jgi:hypothetical protein
LPSSWWCSSWSVSAGVFLFDLFCGGIVSCFSAEPRWAPMLGGIRKFRYDPRTQGYRSTEYVYVWAWNTITKEETRNLLKSAHAPKVVNPLTRALAPPFIGRRRDFYILKIPSNLRNIPNVNMYINVFYIPWFVGLISYIYKPATSSHAKPGLFEVTSLTWLSSDSRILHP